MSAAILAPIERICRSAVPLALGSAAFCLTVMAFGKLTGWIGDQPAQLVGALPLIALILLMMGRVFVHGIALNIAFARRIVAWMRGR
jgi:NAD/NADP transhydrogenase beta subunit